METKTGLVKSGMGKQESFFTEAVKYVEKGVRKIEGKLEAEAEAIAMRSTIFGIAIGVVVGIVGTVVMQKYMTPPASSAPPTPAVPPRA